jgi:uncharacterized membrane protein YfcA
MPDPASILGVALSVLVALSIAVSLGFGSNVIALPIGSHFVDPKFMIPVLACLSVAGSLVMVVKERHLIDRVELGRILLWAAIGFPAGFYGFSRFSEHWLNAVIGVVVTGVAAHGLWLHVRRREPRPPHPVLGRILLVLGGAVHGAIVTGGPLIVAYAVHAMPEKGRFRATLFALWVFLNAFFVGSYFVGPGRDPAVLLTALWCIPAVVAGLWLGQRIHHRLPESWFRGVVLCLLLAAGIDRIFAWIHAA